MKWPRCSIFSSVVLALFAAVVCVVPVFAQQNAGPSSGVVDDWTHHHVFFSDPGTQMDAVMNGRRDEWQRIVNDPRYRLQLIKRRAALTARTDGPTPLDSDETQDGGPMKRDWSVTLGTSGVSVALGMYPTKYTFAPVAAPSCTNDFVVYPVNVAGNRLLQANVVGVTNLYKGTCSGTVPTVLFAYYVGTGRIRTSPVLSLDGNKVAFVESRNSGDSIFHVLTLDKSGNSGCPFSSPCNGSSFDPPAVPGVHNSAVDTAVTMSGSGNVAVTRSSPYVDYGHDVAYVGDNEGRLHKFTGVFDGTPAEVTTSPWPFTVASGVTLTGPTYDSVSGNIFVGGSDGNLYCVTSAGRFCSTKSIAVGNGSGTAGAILDAPIVDSTTQMVFAVANNGSNAILSQSTTELGSQTKVTMGRRGNSLYDGAFDNLYYTNISSGHMYVCGNAEGSTTPTLWRVGFRSNGTIDTSNDGSSFTLADATGVNCSPLTEVYNGNENEDYLFLGVSGHGFTSGRNNCGGTACLASFVLPASGNSVPTAASATMTSTYTGTTGPSGIIVDNVSGTNGASQVYFGAPTLNLGVQASQSGLH